MDRPGSRHKKTGLSPGTIVFVGEESAEPVRITVMDFEEGTLTERTIEHVSDIFPLRDTPTVSWINFDGVHNVEMIQDVGDHFGIHPLVLEDIANTNQRPKIEEYDGYIFVTLKMIYHSQGSADLVDLTFENVSLILGPQYVLTFQEEPGDVFDPVRLRIRNARGRIRRLGADYMAYALIDVIVDHYFVVLERFGELSEDLEDEVLDNPSIETQDKINDLRRGLIHIRRSVWPVREILGHLERLESPLIQAETRPFLRDAYDHAVQVVDIIESLRDLVSGLTDLYMTALSNRMNEIMKVLTIIGTIFIPLTFIAGIYGMNFEYMPELHYRYAYPITWAAMIAIGIVLLFYFRKRDWI